MKLRLLCRKSMLAAAVAGMALSFGAWANEGTGHSVEGKLQKMDTDGDGRISATEHAAGARQMFQKMDTNSDGRVTATEMDASHKEMKGDGKDHKQMSSADKIKTIDTNGDGAITAAEHEEGSRTKFTQMDTDGDGYLSSAELQAGHDRMMSDKAMR